MILGAAFFIFIGFLFIKYPRQALELGHAFTVKKGTEFTEFAIIGTRISGVLMLLTALWLIYLTF